jgi:hypothetical protein
MTRRRIPEAKAMLNGETAHLDDLIRPKIPVGIARVTRK